MKTTAANLGKLLRWIGAVGIVTVAIMRCLIAFAPQIVFDVDPTVGVASYTGFGPAGSLWLDVILLALCGAGLLGDILAGRRVEVLYLALALIPIPIAIWHGAHEAGDMWRGMTWCAAALAAVTIAHLARDARVRPVLIALLIAVLAPLIIRGIANVTYEYDRTVEAFETNKEAIFADKGWSPDSSSAKIYERRLRHREPTAWFLTTNVYGTIMACGVVVLLGCAAGACRSRAARHLGAMLIPIVVGSVVMLWMTGSMGAQGAAIIGLILLILPILNQRLCAVMKRSAHAIGGICIAIALGAILARGTMLPESFLSEKSLLFRWHYQTASSQMLADHYWSGVGPDGYARTYVQYRLPRNPEEVASAHNVYFDWLCSLGVSAAAWIVLTLLMIRRAGARWRDDESSDAGTDDSAIHVRSLICAAAASVIAIGGAVLVERIDPFSIDYVARMIGFFLFLTIAMIAHRALLHVSHRVVNWSLAAAGIVLLVHSQVELTFTQPGAAVWAFCLLGVAAPVGKGRATWPGVAASIGAFALAGWVLVAGAVPALRYQLLMIEAKDAIVESIDQSSEAQMQSRVRAAETLEDAWRAWPIDEYALIVAAEQYERAGRLTRGDARIQLLKQGLAALETPLSAGLPDRAEIIGYYINLQLAHMTGESSYQQDALAIAHRLVEIDPNGLNAWRRLGDLLWDMNRHDEACDAYRRTLEIDDNFSLDPLKQLPDDVRMEIEQRLAASDTSD